MLGARNYQHSAIQASYISISYSDSKSPVILQVSQGGAAFFGGKGLKNSAEKQEASVAGAIAAAHYVRAIAPAYGVPVIMHSDHCAKKLLPWFDGMLDADEKYFKEHGEPLFSCVFRFFRMAVPD